MALDAGSVTIGPTYPGSVVGSGLSLALFNAELAALAAGGAPMYADDAAFEAYVSQFDSSPPSAAHVAPSMRASYLAIKKTNAARATAYAAAIVGHIQAHGAASVAVNALASGVPSSPVQLPIL